MNRATKRKLNAKVNKLSQSELDAVVAQFIYNICSMKLFDRIRFAFKVIFNAKSAR